MFGGQVLRLRVSTARCAQDDDGGEGQVLRLRPPSVNLRRTSLRMTAGLGQVLRLRGASPRFAQDDRGM